MTGTTGYGETRYASERQRTWMGGLLTWGSEVKLVVQIEKREISWLGGT